MDNYITSIFLLINIVIAASAMRLPSEDYYWKEFKGIVPEEALVAGFDQHHHPIYIGQVLTKNKLIPGTIYEDDDNIYYEFGEHAWSANENVNIFCTQTPENFEWISTTHTEATQLSNTLVKGGYESNFKTYIGRKVLNGITNVGKVICREDACLALYVNENGNYQEYHNFEILAYTLLTQNMIK